MKTNSKTIHLQVWQLAVLEGKGAAMSDCKLTTAWHHNSEPGSCVQVLRQGGTRDTSYPGPGGTEAREDESTHANLFCNQAQYWWSLSSTAALVAMFENRSMVAVLSIFWSLYKQAIKVSTRTQARGTISVFVPKGVTRGAGGHNYRAPNQYGGVEWLRGRWMTAGDANKFQQRQLYFFNTVHLLSTDRFRQFEHGSGSAKLASCPGCYLTSLRPCSYPLVKYLSEVLYCAVWVILQEINQLIGIEIIENIIENHSEFYVCANKLQ